MPGSTRKSSALDLHGELVRRMRDSDLVLREKTERSEGVAYGSAQLVGTSTARIGAPAPR